MSAATPSMPDPIQYDKIIVRADRVELTVRLKDVRYRMTNRALMDECLKDFPELASHACHNSQGSTFASVMYHTALPHLLEHLIINFQLKAYDKTNDTFERIHRSQASCESFKTDNHECIKNSDEDFILTGTTQWSSEDLLCACVSVSFRDDLIALLACKEMLAYLNEAALRTIAA